MNYAQLEFYISQPRLNRFLRACKNSKTKAQKLYKINLRVSQSFYPILNLFEIFFRNAIYSVIAKEFTDADWIINEKNGFMRHPSLSRGNFSIKNQILKSENKMRRSGIIVTTSKLIAEQTFGFWTTFFDAPHFKLVRGCTLNAFPNKPTSVNRVIIEQKLYGIRTFRNRIYHNEPICFRGANVDFAEARTVLNDIYDLLNWINPDLKIYIEYFNNITKKIGQANHL